MTADRCHRGCPPQEIWAFQGHQVCRRHGLEEIEGITQRDAHGLMRIPISDLISAESIMETEVAHLQSLINETRAYIKMTTGKETGTWPDADKGGGKP